MSFTPKLLSSKNVPNINGAPTTTLGTGVALGNYTSFLVLGVMATFDRAGTTFVESWSAKSLIKFWEGATGQWAEAKNIWMCDFQNPNRTPMAKGLLLDTGIAYKCCDIVPIRDGDILKSLDFDLVMFG